MSGVAVIIPAGGAGRRLGEPKAQLLLRGRPLLQLATQPFLERSDVLEVVIAVPASMISAPQDWLGDPRVRLVVGGAERSDSVRAALVALQSAADVVLIHDAARPLVSADLIARVIAATSQRNGAIAALPASDTIHETADQRIRGTLDRSKLWLAQTPQAFPRDLLTAAHRKALEDELIATDDAGLVVRYGGVVDVVMGERSNLKITVPEDIPLAEAILAARP
jgi:2-C-methyl-D-erythritol 4-phosphate cytidylyltransferase